MKQVKNVWYAIGLLSIVVPLTALGQGNRESKNQLVQIHYDNQTIAIPLEDVQKSGTLKNLLPEEGSHIIKLEGDVPAENIDQIKQVFDIIKDKQFEPKNPTQSLLKVCDWLNFSAIWEQKAQEQGKDPESYFPRSKKNLRKLTLEYVNTTGDDDPDSFVEQWVEKLGIEMVPDSAFKTGRSSEGLILNIGSEQERGTWWGAHKRLSQETRSKVAELNITMHPDQQKPLNLGHYTALFPRVKKMALKAAAPTDTIHYCKIPPLVPSLHILSTVRALQLHGVVFPAPFSLKEFLEKGTHLETLSIAGVLHSLLQPKEGSICDTDADIQDNHRLRELSLMKLRLTKVPSLMTRLKNLTRLDLRDNKITEIAGNQFPQSLRSCDLSGNPIRKVDDSVCLQDCVLHNPSSLRESLGMADQKGKLLSLFGGTRVPANEAF
jgi:hypothetical protein